ncbi:MAG: hypothetical protein SA339_12185 [Methanomassiliicoccus sp.]|nr:hypothetical protein [Methanomassiliicoccus sp.]
MAVRTFIFNDFSKAFEEACHQKEQGCKVSLGREVGTANKWHVRAEDKSLKTSQGA